MNWSQSITRRHLMQRTAGLGLSLASLELLAACGGQSANEGNGRITATITNAPPDSDKAGQQLFKDTVAKFEQLYPKAHIEGHTYKFDPSTWYTRLAAGQAEDAVFTYFTEPQFMIAHRYAADITDWIKGWNYFSSYVPSVLEIVTGPDGHVYGIPVSGYALCILYSRQLFKQAGLNPDKPPTTWDEFRGYAKQIAGKGVAGYAETSNKYGGGWHFTNWMYTAGGDMEVQQDGKWKAVFNSEKGVAVLELLKAMRFTDKSTTQQQLLDADSILPLVATKKVAMVVTSPSRIADMKVQYQADLEDLGLGPMPQNGGNAALAGGSVWAFNPKSKREALKVAYDWVMYSRFDLNLLSEKYATQAKANQPVGLPTNVLFKGEFQQKLDEVAKRYANVPLQNYQPFTSSSLNLRAEPRTETQKMYAALDPVVQAILTDPKANPKQLLDQAAQQFQTTVLDRVKV